MDLQAHGRTSYREASESIEQDADGVIILLKNLHIFKADFFGFSNGGTTVDRSSFVTLKLSINHFGFCAL
ncbi:MAG: alpha/beta hydrolase [Mucilaginibacter sp.]|nr:alpha/beta hydrolase [Mucilaginibacter sp.]